MRARRRRGPCRSARLFSGNVPGGLARDVWFSALVAALLVVGDGQVVDADVALDAVGGRVADPRAQRHRVAVVDESTRPASGCAGSRSRESRAVPTARRDGVADPTSFSCADRLLRAAAVYLLYRGHVRRPGRGFYSTPMPVDGLDQAFGRLPTALARGKPAFAGDQSVAGQSPC